MMTKLSTVALIAALLSACSSPQQTNHAITISPAIARVPSPIPERLSTPAKQITEVPHADALGAKSQSKVSITQGQTKPPIDTTIGKTSPTKIRDTWAEIVAHQAFAHQVSHSRMGKYLLRYTNKPKHFNRLTKRATPYLPYIVTQLEQQQMPPELALLPFIESGYNPFAYSSSGAAGLWQFIPSTADHLKMKRNWWYDGRRDIVISTKAALQYLSYLHKRFSGDWLLALAAYNGGEGTVSRAIRKNRSKGMAINYWSLDLPSETQAYVPHFLAFAHIVSNPEKYGLKLSNLSPEISFTSVLLDQQIDLQQVARLADIDTEILYQLNPGLLRWASPPSGPFNILLPVNATEVFNTRIASLPRHSWLSTRHHIVQLGDTLSEIAQRYQVPMAAIVTMNKLKSFNIIDGQLLKIPTAANHRKSISAAHLSGSANGQSDHRVRKGDTLSGIANKYQVSVNNLLKWNPWSRSKVLQPGQKLIIK
ncbi:MAG: transglycosylase SLT domain-containing protein [Porticoccaceae bacterium]|nr:transglycosylase SLT domain-containing protein [Porticoccaceae bacterium]